jgi:hypothetical protein
MVEEQDKDHYDEGEHEETADNGSADGQKFPGPANGQGYQGKYCFQNITPEYKSIITSTDMLLRKKAVSGAIEYGIYHFNSSRRFWQDKHCKYVFLIVDYSGSLLTA